MLTRGLRAAMLIVNTHYGSAVKGWGGKCDPRLRCNRAVPRAGASSPFRAGLGVLVGKRFPRLGRRRMETHCQGLVTLTCPHYIGEYQYLAWERFPCRSDQQTDSAQVEAPDGAPSIATREEERTSSHASNPKAREAGGHHGRRRRARRRRPERRLGEPGVRRRRLRGRLQRHQQHGRG